MQMACRSLELQRFSQVRDNLNDDFTNDKQTYRVLGVLHILALYETPYFNETRVHKKEKIYLYENHNSRSLPFFFSNHAEQGRNPLLLKQDFIPSVESQRNSYVGV